MKKIFMTIASVAMLAGTGCAGSSQQNATADDSATEVSDSAVVFFTKEITPESLVKIYKQLGVDTVGNVAIKISTGESQQTGYLRPDFLHSLVDETNGTIVECGTAYGGARQDPALHWKTIREHGFDKVAKVDLMDEFGEMKIPVSDTTHIKYDLVGDHLANYDFLINLAHFKGHAMGGFGGVLKNASIGVASTNGKAYIHSAGKIATPKGLWENLPEQDAFLESMASAAQGVHDYMNSKSTDGSPRVVYINVLNNLSVDCDCDAHPAAPEMKDLGIAASLDPVALDKACLDMVFAYPSTEGDNAQALIERINSRHGTHTVDHAEKIGLGTTKYKLVELDK